jgi:hypothetical protein
MASRSGFPGSSGGEVESGETAAACVINPPALFISVPIDSTTGAHERGAAEHSRLPHGYRRERDEAGEEVENDQRSSPTSLDDDGSPIGQLFADTASGRRRRQLPQIPASASGLPLSHVITKGKRSSLLTMPLVSSAADRRSSEVMQVLGVCRTTLHARLLHINYRQCTYPRSLIR